MSRRPVNPTRRLVGNGDFPLAGVFPSKTRSSPLLPLTLVVLGVFLVLGYVYSGSGRKGIVSRIEGEFSGTLELQSAIPILKKTYTDGMRKVLHVGPETCSIVSKLLKEEGTEAWGVEPYDLEDADLNCKSLVRKGFVRVADIKFPLPYRSQSFRFPGQQRARVTELSKFGRPAKMRSQSWWARFFVQIGVEINKPATKKFEQAATKEAYQPSCQVFHVKSSFQ